MNDQVPPSGDGFEGIDGFNEMEVEQPRRAASIQLTTDEVRERRAASFEAARSSLSEALGITYRILQGGVVALVLLFLLSGFRQVDESERGVRVQFGRVTGQDLEPGFHFSLPRPIGDVRKIGVGAETITLDDAFFEQLSDAASRQPYGSFRSGSSSFDPGVDGSLITSDGNIVLMRLSITYRRANVASYIERMQSSTEIAFVRSLVRRATIAVIAETPVDAIVGGVAADGALADGAPSERLAIQAEIERRSRMLVDEMDIGIEIDNVTVSEAYVPAHVGREFQQVSTAVTQAQSAIEEAQAEREQQLTQVAGAAFPEILRLLDEYERLVDLGDDEQAELLLSTLYAVFDGDYAEQPLVWDGVDFGRLSLGGLAAGDMTRAETYVSQVVSGAESRARIFEAKLVAYQENPEFFVAREWSDAMRDLYASDTSFEVFSVPDAIRNFRLMLNEDPEIRKRREQVRNLLQRIGAERNRNEAVGLEFEG